MGSIFSTINSKIKLYRVDHDLLLSSIKESHTTFFTKFDGLLCNIINSKHKIDDDINLFVYECDLNFFEMISLHDYMNISVFLPIDDKFKNKDDDFCKDIRDLKIGQLDPVNSKNIDKLRDISNKYGSIITIDSSKLGFIDRIDFEIYNFKIKKTFDKLKDNRIITFDELQKDNIIIKKDDSYKQIILDDIKKTKEKKDKELQKEIDGQKKKKKRSKRRKKSKSKKKQ